MPKTASIILRWGLAFVFFYAAIAALINPTYWNGFFPPFLVGLFGENLVRFGFSIFQIALAGWLFWGIKLKWSSLLAAAMLIGIIVVSFDQFEVTFRDVGLAFAALALFELARERNPEA